MIELVRATERLSVLSRPSVVYRAATCVVGLCALAWFAASPGFDGTNILVSGAIMLGPLALTLALLAGWTTTEAHVDRIAGQVLVLRKNPLRGTWKRVVPLRTVSALMERRGAGAHALEILLDDDSTVVLARSALASTLLGSVTREVSEWLDKPVRLAPGTRIADRFEIEAIAGHGGMGVVYRARDRDAGGAVALKVIRSRPGDRVNIDRFARETRVLAGFSHPGIARYVASGAARDGQRYLAMEWLEGEDLARTLERGPLSLARSIEVLSGAARALAQVHARGVIHRDIKPSNLFLRDRATTQAVLLDFGIARDSDCATVLTGTTAIVGTPHYMAPEQASNASTLGPAADVFSLGCIFYECLTGKRAFGAEHLVGVLARILYDEPQPIERSCPDLPDVWVALLARMLAKAPAARPADGAALLAALEEIDAASAAEAQVGTRLAPVSQPTAAVDNVFVCVVLATLPRSEAAEANAERLDPMRSAMHRFGCPLEQLADGSILATVLPRASAVDQVRIAARCALFLREQAPGARIAVATGRAPAGGVRHVGAAADRAAKLLEPMLRVPDVRLDGVSAGLLGDRFSIFEYGGMVLLSGEKPELDAERTLLGKPTRCVGRALELGQLEAVLASALDENVPKSALVLGPPGIGKSRVRRELLRRIGERLPDVAPLIGFGEPLSTGSPYVLLGDALRRRAGVHVGDTPSANRARIEALCAHVEPGERQRVSEFLGELCGVPFDAGESAPLLAARAEHRVMIEQIGLAFIDWLAAECAVQPVVIVFDDVQWGDALTVTLMQDVMRDLTQGRVCMFGFGRPETDQVFPGVWKRERALSLSLHPLSKSASELLVQDVLGDAISRESLTRVVQLAAGNALFLEELIRAAAHGDSVEAPETVVAMLQARLSNFTPELRAVLRAASVLGETFWRGGVERICAAWGGGVEPARALDELVELEMITQQRSSHYPGQTEFMFRHALVCDAARGLLGESDARAAHAEAAAWLETMGEPDQIVLARHIDESGDLARASAYYARAAAQSLERTDSRQALLRARRGIACGATNEVLGWLLSLESQASYHLGDWRTAAESGKAALELVRRGGQIWCSVVEALLQVLPNAGDVAGGVALGAQLLEITPLPEVRPQFMRTVCTQLLSYALAGEYARGDACMQYLAAHAGSEPDAMTRGYADLFRAVYMNVAQDEPERALTHARAAIVLLGQSRVSYRLSFAHTVEAFSLWAVGQIGEAVLSARRGRALAREIRDGYHEALAMWYLGFALCEQHALDASQLDEAERCAYATVELDPSPTFQATSHCLIARVAVFRGDAARAAEFGRKGRDGMAATPGYRMFSSASLVQALVQLGQVQEAADIAREDLAALERLGGTMFSEIMFRVAAAEALFASGDRQAALETLNAALGCIERRASRISDPALKGSFLDGRLEHRRACELSQLWAAG